MKRVKFFLFLALMVFICCQNSMNVNAACDHEYDVGKITTYPTVYENGEKTFTCKKCGFKKKSAIPKYEFNIRIGKTKCKKICKGKTLLFNTKTSYKNIPYVKETVHEHDYKLVGKEEPNCIKDSVEIYACCDCNQTIVTHDKKATGHKIDPSKDRVVPSTCKDEGYTEHTCSVCGEKFNDTYTPQVDHKYGSDGKCVYCGIFDMEKMAPGIYDVKNNEYKLVYSWDDVMNKYKMFSLDQNGKLTQNDINPVTSTYKWANVIGNRFIKLDDSVISMDESTFRWFGNSGVYIPKNMKSYQNGFCHKNTNNYVVSKENPYYKVVNRSIYSSDMTKLIAVPDDTTGVYHVDERVKYIEPYAFTNSLYTGVDLPDNLETMNFAFAWSQIKSVHLPKNLKMPYSNPFASTQSLKQVTIDSDNPYMTVYNNSIYSKDMKQLVIGIADKTNHYTMPETVEVVKQSAMNNTKVIINNLSPRLKTVNSWAFWGDYFASDEIVYPDMLTTIGDGGLGFLNIKKVTLGPNIKWLGRQAICTYKEYRTTELTDIIFKNTNYKWKLVPVDGATIVDVPDIIEITDPKKNVEYYNKARDYRLIRQ